MTSVLGHLYETDFGPEHKKWKLSEVESLFSADIYSAVSEVMLFANYAYPQRPVELILPLRKWVLLQKIFQIWLVMQMYCSYGPIAILRENA